MRAQRLWQWLRAAAAPSWRHSAVALCCSEKKRKSMKKQTRKRAK